MAETGVRNFLYDFSAVLSIQINSTDEEIFKILLSDYQKFTAIINELYELKNVDIAFKEVDLKIYDVISKDDFVKLFNVEFKNKNKDNRLGKIAYYMSKL